MIELERTSSSVDASSYHSSVCSLKSHRQQLPWLFQMQQCRKGKLTDALKKHSGVNLKSNADRTLKSYGLLNLVFFNFDLRAIRLLKEIYDGRLIFGWSASARQLFNSRV